MIAVRHNIEVAHRLWQLPGKCQQIHGHSMWVRMELAGELDSHGLLLGLDFGRVKLRFREWLDVNYDHHLLLDIDDPLTSQTLPGLVMTMGQPSTENIAGWIADWARNVFPAVASGSVTVQETHVNEASSSW